MVLSWRQRQCLTNFSNVLMKDTDRQLPRHQSPLGQLVPLGLLMRAVVPRAPRNWHACWDPRPSMPSSRAAPACAGILILITPTDSCSILLLMSVPHSGQDFADLFSCKGFSCYSCNCSWELFQHSVGGTRMMNLPAELGWISKNLPFGPRAAPSGLGAGFYWPTLSLLPGSSNTIPSS